MTSILKIKICRQILSACLLLLTSGIWSNVYGQTSIKKEIVPVKKIEDPSLIRKDITSVPLVVLNTKEVYDITSTTARCLYEVTNNGAEIVQHGVCVSKGPAPTINGSFFLPKNLGPVFNAQMTNLSPATKFYVRAFAKLKSGEVFYGAELTFTTLTGQSK